MTTRLLFSVISAICFSCAAGVYEARADDLFSSGNWPHLAADGKASAVGDVLSVVVFQNAESRNAGRNSRERGSSIDGRVNAGGYNQSGQLTFGSDYTGRGEINRSESFTTRISVVIDEILPNGDFMISGNQRMRINGEDTVIGVRGRVRPEDITGDNQLLSTRIANAEIDYNGSGFVSKSTKPGFMNKLFSILGL